MKRSSADRVADIMSSVPGTEFAVSDDAAAREMLRQVRGTKTELGFTFPLVGLGLCMYVEYNKQILTNSSSDIFPFRLLHHLQPKLISDIL
jgi:hypothetical protein